MARRRRQLDIPRLGDLEEAVLEHVWERGEVDVIDTHRVLGKPRGISLNTVGSTLERLNRKGLLARHKVSHAYRYTPEVSREVFYAHRAIAAAGGLAALADQGLLAAFVDVVGDANGKALDHLEELIASKRRRS
jgi:predicted transcriptional regulator